MKQRAYYFSDGQYAQLLRQLYIELNKPEVIIQLVGGTKSGKSALCETLALYMERKGHDVVLVDYPLDSPEMLRGVLAQKFDLPSTNNISRQLEDALVAQFERPKILIFDAADQFSDVTLLEILRLSEIQVGSQRVLNVLLCGDLELEKRLQSKKMLKPLLTTISRKLLLSPMDQETVAQLFSDFASKKGAAGIQLSADALALYVKLSKGYPGAVTQIADWLVSDGEGKHDHRVISKLDFSAAVNQEEIQRLLPPSTGFESSQLKILGPIAAVFVVALAGLIFQLSLKPDQGEVAVAGNQQAGQELASPFVEVETDLASTQIAELEPLEVQPQAESASKPFAPSLLQPASVFSLAEETVETPESFGGSADQLAQEDQVQETQEIVSDSALALVTAAELGVTPEIIEDIEIELEPVTEDLSEAAANEPDLLNEFAVNDESPVAEIAAAAILDDTPSPAQPAVDLASVSEANESGDEATETLLEVPGDESEVPTDELAEAVVEIELDSSADESLQNTDSSSVESPDTLVQIAETASVESSSDESLIRDRIDGWVNAWQQQELEGYFASYSERFEPRYESSMERWRASRTRVIGNADWIRLNLSEYEVIEQTSESAEIHFWLDYESPTYRDSTKKKLVLSNNNGDWKIDEEINLQVRS